MTYTNSPSPQPTQARAPSAPGRISRTLASASQFVRVLVLTLYAIWNLPGWMNIRSAQKLATSRRCRIIGYSKLIYIYPLFPAGLILAGLNWMGLPEYILALAMLPLLMVAFLVIGGDIRGRNTIAVIATLAAVILGVIALEAVGVDVVGGVRRAFGNLFPQMNAGSTILISLFALVVSVTDYFVSRYNRQLQVQGNNFMGVTMEQKIDHPIEDWRLRGRIADILESFWMGGREMSLVSNFSAGRRGSGDDMNDAGDRSEFKLTNVPGGKHVEEYVFAAMAIRDVEITGALAPDRS